MRFYRIEITDSNGGNLGWPSSLSSGDGVITSLGDNGYTNPGALNIEIDITQYPMHQAGGDTRSYVRVWGLSLKDISKSFDLNGKNIKIKAGMSKGYPLADASQQGLLVQGKIFQSFGNWLGTDMTADMFLTSGDQNGTVDDPKNYSFTWKKGEKLSDLVNRVIQDVYGGNLTQTLSISNNRTAPADLPGTYWTLTQFGQLIRKMTIGQLSQNDDGVYITLNGQELRAFESDPSNSSSSSTTTKQINFQDLIGQVTWYAPLSLTAKLVMRGDLDVGDMIKFPTGILGTTTAASMPAQSGTTRDRDSIGFSGGSFLITQIQHWGNFRIPDAMAWNTTIWCVTTGSGSTTSAN